jgi:hypothetical protein
LAGKIRRTTTALAVAWLDHPNPERLLGALERFKDLLPLVARQPVHAQMQVEFTPHFPPFS